MVTALKCPIVTGSSILVGGLEEITVSLRGVWGALCLHTAPTEISTRKGVNFRIHHHIHVPRLLMTHKYRGCIIVLLINKSVEPNEEQKVLTSGFDQGITVNTSKQVFKGI
jgi:hypothetical protein